MNRNSLEDNKFQELEFARSLFPLDINILKNAIETRLSLVRLLCDPKDDANAIFESLNAKSEPLKQVDLIKNYIYISLPSEEASEIYRETWRPMELTVESARIERFVWAVVVSSGHTTLQKRTYETVRRLLANGPKGKTRKWVEQLAVEAKYYRSIVDPITESDGDVSTALQAVKMAGGATVEPLLLYAYRSWQHGRATKSELLSAIKSLESFLVRRMLAGEKTQVLNPMVTAMINRLFAVGGEFEAEGKLDSDLKRVLSSVESAWPDYESILRGIKLDNFYASQKSEQRQHILRSLDSALNKTGVKPNYEDSDKSIEHIIPQTPTIEWGVNPGSTYTQETRDRLNSLSNLTLLPSTVNASIGNKSWGEKLAAYSTSGYSITREIQVKFGDQSTWGVEQLDSRAVDLANLSDQLWPREIVKPRFTESKNNEAEAEAELVDEFSEGDEDLILEDDLDT